MSSKIKICGITNIEDALVCARAGADFLGFVFYKKSPRCLAPAAAKEIIERLPASVLKVGVFVNESPAVVKETANACGLAFLQFHGDEGPDYFAGFSGYRVIKAVRVVDARSLTGLASYGAELFLFDTFKKTVFGGTGEVFDWRVLEPLAEKKIKFIISGGLNPGNVRAAVEQLRPFAVDVSSGVEKAPGRKDAGLVEEFIQTVRAAAVGV